MGAGLVKAVFALWPDLPDKPFRALSYMALRAKDGDSPPMYWGGWEDLAFAIGRRLPDEDLDNKEVCRQRRAAEVAVNAVMTALKKWNAVKVVGRPAPGRRYTKWELTIFNKSVQGGPEAIVPSDGSESTTTVQGYPEPSDESGEGNGSGLPCRTVQGYPSIGSGLPCETLQGEPEAKDYEGSKRTQIRSQIDLRAAVTVTRTRGSEEDPVLVDEVASNATAKPGRCDHGLIIAFNEDGDLRCQFCRGYGAEAADPSPPPDSTPPESPPDPPRPPGLRPDELVHVGASIEPVAADEPARNNVIPFRVKDAA